MACRSASALVVLAALGVVTGCGSGAGSTGTGANVRQFRPSVVQRGAAGVDPDQTPLGSRDATTTIRRLGNDRFQLIVQNTSGDGFINSFAWKAAGLTITTVIGSSNGTCRLLGRMISCTHVSLRPPTCLCRPGGSMTIDFKAIYQAGDTNTLKYGITDSALWIGDMTLVPYIIPSHAGVKPWQADLPLCAKGQQSTSRQPCVHSD